MDTNERIGIIYQAKCLVTGKSYIGQTVQGLEKRKWSHLSKAKHGCNFYFHRAIRKYGDENFCWTTIAIVPEKRLENLERAFIKTMNTFGSGGYNMTEGGESQRGEKNGFFGKKHTLETCKKMSENHADVSGENNPSFGKDHSGEKNGNAKLSENCVRKIKEFLLSGKTQVSIAKKFGITQTTVSGIKTGRLWKHINKEA